MERPAEANDLEISETYLQRVTISNSNEFPKPQFFKSSFPSRMRKNDSVPQYFYHLKRSEHGYGMIWICFAPKMEGFTKAQLHDFFWDL